jgi:hypothetical protein
MAWKEKTEKSWLDDLSDEDLTFIKRFILASGSLKEIAKQYGITYPTVRLRLDRLIQKIKVLDSQDIADEFERILRVLYAEKKIDATTFRTLLSEHNNYMKKPKKGEP